MITVESNLGPASADAHIAPVPPPDIILQVRSGKVQPLGTAGIRSGINKLPHESKVLVGKCGIVGDEVQYEHHGGPEKALHQYCPAHYAAWREEKPEKAHLFVLGGFGENLVSSNLNEDNVCIGDVFRIGPKVHVVVMGPRLPCYKLQHRFEWNRASIRAQETNRVGWYYGVLRTGTIEAGNEMVLLKRPYPTWPVSRVLDVMFRHQQPALYGDILQLDPLGSDIREVLAARLVQGQEDASGRLNAVPLDWNAYKLVRKRTLTPRIKSFTFQICDQDARFKEPEFGPFPFVRLRCGTEDCYNRAYSVVGGDKNEFELGIALDRESRGGSKYLHESLEVAGCVSVAIGKTAASKDEMGDAEEVKYRIFIVGGVGITAFIGEIGSLVLKDLPFEVHYACSSMDDAAYTEALPRDKTTYYAKDKGERLKIEGIIHSTPRRQFRRTKIFCCGPTSLMEACQERARRVGYPEHLQHYESFGGDSGGEPFEAEISSSGEVLQVPENKSLLKVLQEAGISVASSCQVGNCGMCMVDYKSGLVQHKGTALQSAQKCNSMLSCVSRGKDRVVLDL